MDFYGRQSELALMQKMWQASKKKASKNKANKNKAKMLVITGRRRVGKTLLTRVFAKDKPHLYLFIAKKTEVLLCQEFIELIRETFSIPILGEIKTFRDIFTLLLEIGKTHHFILIIDEVQEFLHINPSIFSDMQKIWDQYLFQSQVQVILMGSIYSLMHKIFEDLHEPLFGRADRILRLKPFSIAELRAILSHYGPADDGAALFHYYLITGGVPQYVEKLLEEGVFKEKEIYDFIFSENSPFIHEGKNVLIEEFGKEYWMYFSILELIASGKTSRSEIESLLQKDIGGYLERLENYFGIIKKVRPIHAKPQSKMVRYRIEDLFLRFWFRFIFSEWSAIETANFDYVKQILNRDLRTYMGGVLESFFKSAFEESKQFNEVGSYWEYDNSNEIDLVAVNDLKKRIVIAEIKCNKEKFRKEALKKKAEPLLLHYPGYTPEYLFLSLDEVHAIKKD
jgi:AAA+ ATPase superfamily predicted ATPase